MRTTCFLTFAVLIGGCCCGCSKKTSKSDGGISDTDNGDGPGGTDEGPASDENSDSTTSTETTGELDSESVTTEDTEVYGSTDSTTATETTGEADSESVTIEDTELYSGTDSTTATATESSQSDAGMDSVLDSDTDSCLEHDDVMYQSFEEASSAEDINFWPLEETTVRRTVGNEPVFEGAYALRIDTPAENSNGDLIRWVGAMIKPENDTWHIDLKPNINDRLHFWVYVLPISGLDTTLEVQFYDHGDHNEDENAVKIWTRETAVFGRWTRLTVLFSEIPETFDLSDVNKIQLNSYWPGTFYIDSVYATSGVPEWRRFEQGDRTLSWHEIDGSDGYILEESPSGEDGTWEVVYQGPSLSYDIPRVTKTYYRLSTLACESVASKVSRIIEYNPPLTVIDHSSLRNEGVLRWSTLPQATGYEIQSSPDPDGDQWTTVYTGAYPETPPIAEPDTWYRVRSLGDGDEMGRFGPQVINAVDPSVSPFIKAVGRELRIGYGSGDSVVLKGVNLGSWLLIEPWMSGFGKADDPELVDECSIRDAIREAHSPDAVDELIGIYQDSWIKEGDLDRIVEMGLNTVRLNIHYLNLMDETGELITNGSDAFDFGKIDWLVEAAADRGLYVILDLHGAPGGQNHEFHSGCESDPEAGVTELFNNTDTPEGETYQERTVRLWEAIAEHYKDHPNVAGYDLLNEPTGFAVDPINIDPLELPALWDLYDRLYEAVRAVDPDHVIFIEATWDFDQLPNPANYAWENVVYEFHYYRTKTKEEADAGVPVEELFDAQRDFIDEKIEDDVSHQNYGVPVLVGEFSAFSLRESWDYFFSQFDQAGWSWTLWSYKTVDNSTTWGIYNGFGSETETAPSFTEDSPEELRQKLSQVDTLCDFHPHVTFRDLITEVVPPQPD